MNARASTRTLTLSFAGSLVVAASAVLVALGELGRLGAVASAWLLASGFLASTVTGGLMLGERAARARGSRAEADRLRADLDKLQTRMKELSIAQGRFVGNIAHEIKTPLSIVLSQLELLLRCSNDPVAVRGHARSIAEDMRHLSDLVGSFLRLARPFAQEDRSQHQPVYIHDVVVEAVRRCQSMARECGVSIVPTLAEPANGNATPEVLGDDVLLEAMLENLLRNAMRLSPGGSRVEVRVLVRAESVLVYVRDRGAGISAELAESVFDWFFRDQGRTLQSTGTGFGLAIARRIAEHHRGTISVRNHPEGGCEFAITLPQWRADGPPGAPGDAPIPA